MDFNSIKEWVKNKLKEKHEEIKYKNSFVKKTYGNTTIAYHEKDKKIYFNSGKIMNFNDILDCELLEDGISVTKTSSLGKAVVGGMLFGGIGAIVGGITGKQTTKGVCTKLDIKITINDFKKPCIYINLIAKKTKKNSSEYKKAYSKAQEILSLFQVITSNKEVTA